MSNVKSTYNFVPAPSEQEVFKPYWAKQVSHDIPFSDGESGEIEIKITAETPIFIRNGHKKGVEDNEFSHYVDESGQKVYFIPGSSLKGMFRNVLEIMSLSRMNKNLVNDDRYSYRDLSNANNLYMTNFDKDKIQAGWLIEKTDGSWEIEECADLAFIHHEELLKTGIPFRKLFLNNSPRPNEKSAKYKYDLVDRQMLNGNFSISIQKLFGNVERKIASYNSTGKVGTLVFSGQPGKRNESNRKSSGKVHEFVFFNAENPNKIQVSSKMQKDFKFIYYDHDKNNISADWKYWRDNFLEKDNKVPVFYAKDEKGNLYHFGLSYMYKLPYSKSVHEMQPFSSYQNEEWDLSTTIFGCSDEKSLMKGRVMIGHAINTNNIQVAGLKKEILGGPKASYFPYYIEQIEKDGKVGKYSTFEDNANVRGYKRYPTHSVISTGNYDEKQLKNQRVFSSFIPLNSGGEFVCKIKFHNLKKEEIGALVSTITFNGNVNCKHTLGGAKSYGYGKIKVEIVNLRFLHSTIQDYNASFKSLMSAKIKNWEKLPQLRELFAMASNTADTSLMYPSISDFVEIKKDKEALYKFSEIAKPEKPVANIKAAGEGIAIITVTTGNIQAKLLEGKDLGSKPLNIPNINPRYKPKKYGEKIKVKIIYNKGGNIEKFEFISKL